jgi:hypothetical protein
MQYDKRGLALTTDSRPAVRHLDAATTSILAHRKDAGAQLALALAADPGLTVAHAVHGLARMVLARSELTAAARADAASARRSLEERGGTPRERALVQALELWLAGAMEAAAATLERSLTRQPQDALVFKLCYSLCFMLGDVSGLRRASEIASHAWGPAVPDHGFVLGCLAFALEETGELDQADFVGRRAVEIEPLDAWGCHAVAHVFDSRRQAAQGAAWLAERRRGFAGLNNFARHLAWHEALFRLASGETDAVLALYDREVRDERTDDYRDVANAASLLWRLKRRGIPVGRRWQELADLAERRIADSALAFAGLHYLMSLVASGRGDAAAGMLSRMRLDARSPARTQDRVLSEVGLPLAEIIADPASLGRQPIPAAARLGAQLARLGGSRAQRSVFWMILEDAAEATERGSSRRTSRAA